MAFLNGVAVDLFVQDYERNNIQLPPGLKANLVSYNGGFVILPLVALLAIAVGWAMHRRGISMGLLSAVVIAALLFTWRLIRLWFLVPGEVPAPIAAYLLVMPIIVFASVYSAYLARTLLVTMQKAIQPHLQLP
jgi:hypothetical protein